MSSKKTAQGKPTKKANSGNNTDVDYKSKHKEIEAELVKARKETKSVKNALLICQYDLSVVRNNFNYEEVRKLLPMSQDVDGIQSGETARLTIELKQLQQELDKLKGSQHGNGAATQSPNVLPDADTNKLQTLQTENEKLKKQQQTYEDNIKRVTELEKDKNQLKQEISKLEEENEKLKTQLQSIDERNAMEIGQEAITNKNKFTDQMIEKERELEEAKSQISELKSELEAIKKENTNTKHTEGKNQETEKKPGQTKADDENFKDQIKESDRKNEMLNEKIRVLETELKGKEETIQRLERDLETKRIPGTTKKGENNDNAQIEDTEKKLKKSNDKLLVLESKIKNMEQCEETAKKEHAKLQKETDELKSKFRDTEQSHTNFKQDNDRKMKDLTDKLNEEKKEYERHLTQLKNDNTTLRNQLDEEKNKVKLANAHPPNSKEMALSEEIENLKTRLSQMAGAQLMTNNPNIADLSDQNRPTKLAEQYTELYDNEWTNVYEILEQSGKSERAIIETLYGILKDTYTFCIEVSKEQTKHLKLAVTSILQQGKPLSDEEIPVTKLRQLRDLRKTFAPDMIDSVFEYYKRKKSPKDINKSEMKTFVHKCITLCWLMNVQDPPVVVDTKQHAGTFNSDIFKTYTKTGKEIAFIVWPPLYLHADGPMLSKGIAQGK